LNFEISSVETSKELLELNWPILEKCTFSLMTGGLINSTWHAKSSCFDGVVQWVNPIFSNKVNFDIREVTLFLKEKGIPSLTLIDNVYGLPSVPVSSGSWRVFEFLWGRAVRDSADFTIAASSLGVFHSALSAFDYKFKHSREIHNSEKHLQDLLSSIEGNPGHPLFDKVNPLAEKVVKLLTPYSLRGDLPKRVVHGDPKLENFIMTEHGAVLIDLDTVGRHDFIGEIGDALRSWCREKGVFDLSLFEQFISGYFRENSFLLTTPERSLLSKAPFIIALELSARFLSDSLNESYFGWDPKKFSTRGEHNFARAEAEFIFAISAMENEINCSKILSNHVG
jgi:Phosphotransferase enzyme family